MAAAASRQLTVAALLPELGEVGVSLLEERPYARVVLSGLKLSCVNDRNNGLLEPLAAAVGCRGESSCRHLRRAEHNDRALGTRQALARVARA